MLNDRQVTCWVVTDGRPGLENQCLGLAEACGAVITIKRVKIRTPWRQLSPFLRHGLSYAYAKDGDPVEPPWPDLLIATGRASVPAALRARRESRTPGTHGTMTVFIQNPVISSSRFDFVVAPRHDNVTGANVISTRGSLHRVTPLLLEREMAWFLPTIAHLPKPYITVSIGGSNSVYQLTVREMRPLTQQLNELIVTTGGSLLITPSRRTGIENIAVLKEGLTGLPHFLWDGTGRNPYYGMLGVASSILVTGDSVNMISEACSTGKPTYVIELAGGSDKFRRFHQILRDDGLTQPFRGRLEPFTYPPLNETALVAKRVMDYIANRQY